MWGPVNQIGQFEVPQFSGTPGLTNTGEWVLAQNPEELAALKKTRLFFFEKFIDTAFVEHVVRETNRYVREMGKKQ